MESTQNEQTPNNEQEPQEEQESRLKRGLKGFLLGITMLLLIYMVGVLGYGVWSITFRILQQDTVVNLYLKTIFDHFAAVVGLPFASVGSLFLVLLLRYSAGPIEFEGLGFKFKGASGPIVMWVLCFLATVSAIKLLW